jgi:hypothetical protein
MGCSGRQHSTGGPPRLLHNHCAVCNEPHAKICVTLRAYRGGGPQASGGAVVGGHHHLGALEGPGGAELQQHLVHLACGHHDAQQPKQVGKQGAVGTRETGEGRLRVCVRQTYAWWGGRGEDCSMRACGWARWATWARRAKKGGGGGRGVRGSRDAPPHTRENQKTQEVVCTV